MLYEVITNIPLSEMIVDFFDQLKSRTRGYASLDYQCLEYRPEALVKLEILVNEEPVDALASIVHREHEEWTRAAEVPPERDFAAAAVRVVD